MADKIISLICERSCELTEQHLDANSQMKDISGCSVIKFPCSGMIQPLMIEAALKSGADGVVVTGCELGDCYYREGNRMIRERLLGTRPPTLKPKTDRRRVMGLWLSRVQTDRWISEVKEFRAQLEKLPPPAPEAKKAPAQPKAE
jgi:coenzyme F420-reducing hydrogenase delta subunit